MREAETTRKDGVEHCLRHPTTETNLRCGRCDDLICPRCLVTSPVGARCPNCARIGRPKILDTSAVEMGRAIIFGVVAAILTAAVLAGAIFILDSLPGAIFVLDMIVITGGLIVAGYVIGEGVRIGSGNKLDRRLKYVAMGCTFLAWLFGIAFLPIVSVPAGYLASYFGIFGMVIGVYAASMRVRIP